jgi:hypothetical protein
MQVGYNQVIENLGVVGASKKAAQSISCQIYVKNTTFGRL